MIYKIEPFQLVLDRSVRGLCVKPYPGHTRGCPNFDHKQGCPPQAAWWADVYDTSIPVYAIVSEFDFGAHVEAMRQAHPDWSERQLKCCLYWQGTARARLKELIAEFKRPGLAHDVVTCPEAMGVHVFQTMANVGVILEWPVVKIERKVAIAAIPKDPGATIPQGLF